MNIELPLDVGFLRRQCPSCNRKFKWHHGPVEGAPESIDEGDFYYCPLCGEAGKKDAFYTHEQVQFMQWATSSYAHREVQNMLADAFRGSKGIKYKSGEIPGGPAGLFEPSDMIAVQPPCHPWEPVKVPEGWAQAIYCLICGSPFRI